MLQGCCSCATLLKVVIDGNDKISLQLCFDKLKLHIVWIRNLRINRIVRLGRSSIIMEPNNVFFTALIGKQYSKVRDFYDFRLIFKRLT